MRLLFPKCRDTLQQVMRHYKLRLIQKAQEHKRQKVKTRQILRLRSTNRQAGDAFDFSTAAQAYADTAEADAIPTAAADATTKADAAQAAAESLADTQDAALIGDNSVDGTAGNTVKDSVLIQPKRRQKQLLKHTLTQEVATESTRVPSGRSGKCTSYYS